MHDDHVGTVDQERGAHLQQPAALLQAEGQCAEPLARRERSGAGLLAGSQDRGVVELAGVPAEHREIAGSEEQHVDPLDLGDGPGLGERVRRLDLRGEERLAIRGGHVIGDIGAP